jgi:hypothetical protein
MKPKSEVTQNPVYLSSKSSLEDHQSQTGSKITKKVVREVVSYHGPFLEKEELDAIVKKLSAVMS